jgi:serine/threonine protein kinase
MIAAGARLKDRYLLERLLGRGGMASVWLARDLVLDRPVAIKVLSDTIASDPEFVARFRREAQVAAGLSHPNLVGVYDYAEGEERPYLVMEYVPGDNLAERVSQGAEIDCEGLARELLGALAHIHAAGILHRDVKPQNVLLAADGGVKLIDFGIALPRDAPALTRTGNLLGTARYVAPEVMGGSPATERSDLYSCGVLLGDCAGGSSPHRLRALADRLAAPEPHRRPASAQEALARLGGGSRTAEPTKRLRPTESARRREPAGPVPPLGRPEPSPPRRVAGRVALVLVGLVALAGAFLLLDDGDSSQKPGGNTDSSLAVRDAEQGGASSGPEEKDGAAVPAPAGNDSALGGSLNEEGFELIQAGRYEEAVPLLEEAVRTFPPGTTDLNYAYALFNLGNALRLSGRPEDAIPVLERRLQIPNQTGVVRRELAAAQRAASA